MVFKTSSTTVLLAATLIFLASIAITPKANAQEVLTENILLGKNVQTCPMAQFTAVADFACKKPFSLAQNFLPTTVFLPSPTTSSLTETFKPQETVPSVSVAPSMQVSSPTATLSADVLFSLVNAHRASINLPPFEHDGAVCAVADSRKEEIVREIFVTHALHSGFYAKNLPYWATENLIWQHTEVTALNWWLHSPVHRAAIEGNYKYACGVCNGDVCNMVFTNYEKKTIAAVPETLNRVAAVVSTTSQDASRVSDSAVHTTNSSAESLGTALKVNP